MNRCNICEVEVVGNIERCPLCKNKLKLENKSKNVYPHILTLFEKNKLLFQVLRIIAILGAISAVVINIFVTPRVLWCSFVILGEVSSIIIIQMVLNRKSNLIKLFFYQTIIISLLALVWDLITGWHNWSIDFVLPLTFATGLLMSYITGKILKLKPADTLFYITLEVVLGFIPLLLVVLHKVNVMVPSLISILMSQTFLVIILVFEGKNILKELKRRLHM